MKCFQLFAVSFSAIILFESCSFTHALSSEIPAKQQLVCGENIAKSYAIKVKNTGKQEFTVKIFDKQTKTHTQSFGLPKKTLLKL